jgi:hypothetical protein
MIKNVYVKNSDDSSKYLYPSRVIEIKTNNGNILTPTRAATSKEYEDKSTIPTDLPINNQITITIEHVSHTKFHDLINIGNYYPQLSRKIELNKRLAQYSSIFATLLIPMKSPKIDKKTNEILLESPRKLINENINIRDKFLRLNIQIQKNAGLDLITIPFLNLPFESFKTISSNINKELEKINLQPIFFIDFEYEKFESAIDWLYNDLQSNFIGLYYRSFNTASLKYDYLSRNYSKKDVAFISAQVERRDTVHDDVATMHYLPFMGNDIYAVKNPLPFGSSGDDETKNNKPKNPLDPIRLFDKWNLNLKKIESSPLLIKELERDYSNDLVIQNILNHYSEASTNTKKLEVLRAFSKVDELRNNTKEFSELQNYVSQNSTNDYVEEKTILQKALLGVTKHQTKLKF